MRVAIDPNDAGYNAYIDAMESGKEIIIRLNGEPLKRCIMADEEKGEALCYSEHIPPGSQDWPTELLHGKVEIEVLRETWKPEGEVRKHVFYTKEDADCPEVLKDSNGDIVLMLCRACGHGEGDLDPYNCPGVDPRPLLEVKFEPDPAGSINYECVDSKGNRVITGSRTSLELSADHVLMTKALEFKYAARRLRKVLIVAMVPRWLARVLSWLGIKGER